MSGKQEKVRDACRDQRVVHAENVVGAETQVEIGELYVRKAIGNRIRR